MKKIIYKWTFFTIIGFFGMVILNSCSKDDTINTVPVPLATSTSPDPRTGLFNRDLVVTFAQDDNTNITAQFEGISLRFANINNAVSGEAYAMNRSIAVQGNWTAEQSNETKIITIAIPSDLMPALAFVNRQWKVNDTGSTIILTPANGENDALYLATGK